MRLRLNSTVIHARNVGDPATAKEVEITYVKDGHARTVRCSACILACWNMVVPYLCPDLPDKQKEALAYGVKIPLVYTNVLISNWQSFKKLGISAVRCPGSYFDTVTMDFPVSMGDYKYGRKSWRTLRAAPGASSVQGPASRHANSKKPAAGNCSQLHSQFSSGIFGNNSARCFLQEDSIPRAISKPLL